MINAQSVRNVQKCKKRFGFKLKLSVENIQNYNDYHEASG